MSAEPDSSSRPDRGRSIWIITAAVVLTGTLAVFSYSFTEESEAASGAVIYDTAVKEALRGLSDPAAHRRPAGGGRPQLPAGLSPDEHYWCENCKAWHKKQQAAGPQSPQAAPPTPRVVVPYALGKAPGDAARSAAKPAAGTIPPLPEGLSPEDYSWCENCKSYHKRDAGAAQPHGSAATPPPRRVVPPYRLGMAPGDAARSAAKPAAGTIPPLPAGLSPDDHSWCENCKSYHKRDAGAAQPHGSAATKPPPLPAQFSPDDYYWCDKCRAYHLRSGAPPKSHNQ